MDAINSLLDMNIIKWLYGLIIILCGANFIISSVAKFCEWIGKPLSWFNKTAKDHEMLIELKAKHEKDYDILLLPIEENITEKHLIIFLELIGNMKRYLKKMEWKMV